MMRFVRVRWGTAKARVWRTLACTGVVLLLWAVPASAQPLPGAPQGGPAAAQAEREQTRPYNNAPVWREARSGEEFTTQVQNIDAGVLINPGGETWRAIRNGLLTFWGGLWLIAVPIVILAFYFVVGPLRLHDPPTGREILRFAAWERALHWTTAIAFIVMAVTGFIVFFGKYYLAILLTYPVFSWVARFAVTLHNFTAPVFVVASILLFLTFVGRNTWHAYDTEWVKHGGGLVSKHEPPSGFFNAGEKLWFWGGLSFLGVVMTVSGLVLLFPIFGQTRNVMAGADIVHLVGALLFAGAAFGHIYMGTIGMIGAYRAMRRGVVDETWAREHHSLWYDDLAAGRVHEPSELPLGGTRVRSGEHPHSPIGSA